VSKLTNFEQCPDIDCNGNLEGPVLENKQPLKTERVYTVQCTRCNKTWTGIMEPNQFEEV
jgi:hypothetical protein